MKTMHVCCAVCNFTMQAVSHHRFLELFSCLSVWLTFSSSNEADGSVDLHAEECHTESLI